MQESRNTSRETVLEKVGALTAKPIAFEALWAGDSFGWFIYLNAITDDGEVHYLGTFSGGGDLRIFNGQVPLWPEAAVATQIGTELAAQYGAEFYFPSPNHPEEDCPSWNERAQGYPCRRCGILLLQGSPCPWRGACYYCHLAEEREQREAQWTPEQRAGRRCSVCGNPATAEVRDRPLCAACLEKYEFFNCEQCDTEIMRLKTYGGRKWCSRCQAKQTIETLSESQLNIIREALTSSHFEAMHKAVEILDCSTREGSAIATALMRQQSPNQAE